MQAAFIELGLERTAFLHASDIARSPHVERPDDAGEPDIRESVRELAAHGMTSLLIWVLRENRIGRSFYERLGGVPRREKPVDMPGIPEGHVEIAYCWDDTKALA